MNKYLLSLLASSVLTATSAYAATSSPIIRNETNIVDTNRNTYFIRQVGALNNTSAYTITGTHNNISRSAYGSGNSFSGTVAGNYSAQYTNFWGNNNKAAPVSRTVVTASGNKTFAATNALSGNYTQSFQDVRGVNNTVAAQGTGNYSSLYQFIQGSNNVSAIRSNGHENAISTTIGHAFYATATTSVNTANNNNVLLADVTGSWNSVEAIVRASSITSSVSDNKLYLSVVGSHNAVRATQNGNNNEMAVAVNGNDNKLITQVTKRRSVTTPLTFAQTGNNNTMRVTVNGNGNGGTISQIGNGLNTTAVYNVSGHKF